MFIFFFKNELTKCVIATYKEPFVMILKIEKYVYIRTYIILT